MKKTILTTITMFSLLFSSCTKETNSCKTCEVHPDKKEIFIDEDRLVGNTYQRVGNDGVKISYFDNKNKNTIKSILENCNIIESESKILGLALFYNQDVKNYGQLKQISPSAVVLYIEDNDFITTKCLFKNSTNDYILDQDLVGITNMVAGTDLVNIDLGGNLNSEEIVILFDTKKIPKKYYKSDFQTKTLRYGRPVPGDEPGSLCSVVPECKNYQIAGDCIFSERQNGPVEARCWPDKPCASKKIAATLIELGKYIAPDVLTKIYALRDDVLSKSRKGSIYIDNYYYASEFFSLDKIDSDYLNKMLIFFNSNLPNKLSKIKDSNYKDSILINQSEKALINELIQKSKSISNDTRYQNIFNSLQNDLDLYSGKTISDINNEFK